MGNNSGTGVAFTRDPNTGEDVFYGDYLINAQGEDVVAGIRTPEPISRLQDDMPKVYDQLMGIREKLEQHYKEMQDIEFTVQDGTFYMLQTRTGKRTGSSAVRIAVEMVNAGLIDRENRDQPGQPERPEPPPPAEPRPESRRQGRGAGDRRQPGSRRRQGDPLGRGRRRVCREAPGRVDHARPQGNQPRGRRRDAPGQGDPHGNRRQGQPRGGRRRGWGKPCVVGCDKLVPSTRRPDQITIGGRLSRSAST